MCLQKNTQASSFIGVRHKALDKIHVGRASVHIHGSKKCCFSAYQEVKEGNTRPTPAQALTLFSRNRIFGVNPTLHHFCHILYCIHKVQTLIGLLQMKSSPSTELLGSHINGWMSGYLDVQLAAFIYYHRKSHSRRFHKNLRAKPSSDALTVRSKRTLIEFYACQGNREEQVLGMTEVKCPCVYQMFQLD